VQSLCAPLRPFRNETKEAFYPMYCRCAVWTRIKIFRYLVTRCHKKCQLCRGSAKTEGSATFCAHRNTINLSRAIFKNVLGLFIGDDFVVVLPCTNFSLCCQMAPLRSIKFQTADFPIFWVRIVVILTTCIGTEVFSLAVIGNL